MVNHYEVHKVFQYIEHYLRKNILHHFLHYRLFMKYSLNIGVTFIHSQLFTGSSCNIAQP